MNINQQCEIVSGILLLMCGHKKEDCLQMLGECKSYVSDRIDLWLGWNKNNIEYNHIVVVDDRGQNKWDTDIYYGEL